MLLLLSSVSARAAGPAPARLSPEVRDRFAAALSAYRAQDWAQAAVTRDDPGTRMLSKPARQGCRLIVGQHVNRPPDCQVHQHQAKAQRSSVQREIIHS